MSGNRAVLLNLPKTQSLDIEFSNIEYEVTVGFRGPTKHILKGVNGHFKAGELTAIMGPSGAGKSSLLNILTGFNKSGIKGSVEYQGSEGKRGWREYRKESCYIQQDDQLHALFTVQETMTMATDLKLGHSLNRKAKQMVIDEILETLDLMKTKETRCDKLSGGQRKRLSIALELVDNPPVMFLDEPTTGLDSVASFQVVSMLRGLARGSRTIVCTIHQPSAVIYEMFDHIYLLAEGKCVFQGAATNTVGYFSNMGFECPKYHNPADYMIEVVSKEYGNFNDQLAAQAMDVESKWRVNSVVAKLDLQDLEKQKSNSKTTVLVSAPSELIRFFVLLNRAWILLYRDWTVTHLKLALHVFTGIILGLLYENAGSDGSKTVNNIGFSLVSTVYLCYTSMMPAVLKFPSELPILRKEQFNNWYKLRTYYLAILLANMPIQMIFAMIYTAVSYTLSNQPMEPARFCMFIAISVLTVYVAESLGLILGTLLNPVNGTFVGAISVCAMLTFAGFLVLFNHMPLMLYYLSYLSYLRYSMEGMVLALYGFGREKLDCPEEVMYCHYRYPESILSELAMDKGSYWIDFGILLVNMVILRIVAYCTLKRKVNM